MEQGVLDFTSNGLQPGGLEPPYSAAWLAVWNAIATYPDRAQDEGWQWKLPYYMALAGETDEAVKIYVSRIVDALNQEGIAPAALPNWFHSGELDTTTDTPHFALQIRELPLAGTDSSYLINLGELDDIDTPGSSCLLIVKREGGFQGTVLYNGFPHGGYFITLRNPSRCYPVDVTGDGTDEVLVDHYYGGHVGTTSIMVFDLSSGQPQVMPFGPDRLDRLQLWNGWIESSPASGPGIHVSKLLGECEGSATYDYQWNGAWFELTSGRTEGPYSAYPYCVGWITSVADELTPGQAYSLYNEVFEFYQQESTTDPEMLEELRVRQAMSAAYAGDSALAISSFNEAAESPLIEESEWTSPAREFLERYSSPVDLYSACPAVNITVGYYEQMAVEPVHLTVCSPTTALQDMIANAFSHLPLTQLRQHLSEAGVQILSDGWFDFDQDQQDEWWFVVRHPGEQDAQLWVAVQSARGIKGLFASYLSQGTDPLLPFAPGPPASLINENGSTVSFQIVRRPRTSEPFLAFQEVREPDPLDQALNEFKNLRAMLIMGGDPTPIYALLNEQRGRSDQCPFETTQEDGSAMELYDCATYFFSFGLAAELSGNPTDAIEDYSHLLNAYPDSPAAQLAALKLER